MHWLMAMNFRHRHKYQRQITLVRPCCWLAVFDRVLNSGYGSTILCYAMLYYSILYTILCLPTHLRPAARARSPRSSWPCSARAPSPSAPSAGSRVLGVFADLSVLGHRALCFVCLSVSSARVSTRRCAVHVRYGASHNIHTRFVSQHTTSKRGARRNGWRSDIMRDLHAHVARAESEFNGERARKVHTSHY